MKNLLSQLHNSVVFSLPIALIIEGLSSLQIIHLTFQCMSYTLLKKQILLQGIFKALPFFTGAFNMNNYYNSETFVLIAWCMFIGYFLLHFFLFAAAVSSLLVGKRPHKFIFKTLGISYLLHARIFFFPIQYFFVNIMILWRDTNQITGEPFYSHHYTFVITILAFSANILLAIAKEFILYQTNFGKCAYGAKTNFYGQIMFINKLVGVILYMLSQNEVDTAIKGSSYLCLLFGLGLLYILYTKLPFYKFQVLKIAVIMTSLILSFSLIAIIQVHSKDEEVLGGLQIFVALLPLLGIKGIFSQFRNLFEKILKGKFQFPGQGIHFALLLGEFVTGNKSFLKSNKSFLPSYHKFIGILANQGIDLEMLADKRLKNDIEPSLSRFIIEKLKQFFEKNSKSQMLSIFLAQFYIVKLGNFPKALELMKKLENNSLSLSMQKTMEYVYLELEEGYIRQQAESEGRMQISSYFQYSDFTRVIKSNIQKEITNQTEFWEDVQKGNLDLKKVADKVEEIHLLGRKVKKDCENNTESFSKNFSLPLLVYAAYLNIVKHSYVKSFKFLQKFQSLLTNNYVRNEFDVYAESSAAAIVSIDKAKIGEILAVSGSIQNLFHVNKQELIGKKFSYLFPPSIAQSFYNIIQKYSKSLDCNVDEIQKTFGQTVYGEVFEVEVNFQIFPYSNYEITLLVLMKKIGQPEPVLIVDPIGRIVCCSKSLEEKLKKEAVNITAFKMIQDIIVDFTTINKAFNMTYNMEANKEVPEQFNNPENSLHSIKPMEDKTTERLAKDVNKFQSDDYILESKNTNRLSVDRDEDTSRVLIYPKKSQPMKNHFNFKDTSRVPSTFLRKTMTSEWADSIKQTPRGLTTEKAQELCEKFLNGNRIDLYPSNNSPRSLKKFLRADVQIKPYFLEGELHKIILFKNILRESCSMKTGTVNTIDNENSSFSHFADEFVGTEEMRPSSLLKGKKPKVSVHTNRTNQTKDEELLEEETESHASKVMEELSLEKNDGKENLRATMIQKIEKDDQKSSLITSNYRDDRAMKVIKQVSSKKKSSPLLKSLKIALFSVIFVMFVMCGVNFVLIRDSIFQIEESIILINTATSRLQAAITSWQWTLVFIAGGSSNPGMIAEQIFASSKKLIDYNNQLKNLLTSVHDHSLLAKIFKENIYVWTPAIGAGNNYTIEDSFSANDILTSQYLALYPLIKTNKLSSARRAEALLTLNNTINDYVLTSEDIIIQTGELLRKTISKDLSILRMTLAIEIIFIVVFSIVLILMAVVIVRSYRSLFYAVTRTSDRCIVERLAELKRSKHLFEQDIETKAFIHNAFEVFTENNKKAKAKKNHETRKMNNTQQNNLSLTNMNKYLAKNVFFGLIFAPIFAVLFGVWLMRSISTFKSFERTNERVAILSEGWYQNSMILGNIVTRIAFISMPTMKIRNQSAQANLVETVEQLVGLNKKLSNSFLVGSDIDLLIQDVLESNVCNYLDETTKGFCKASSLSDKFGLMNLNTQYYDVVRYVMSNLATITNIGQALVMFATLFPTLTGSMRTIEAIYPFLIDYIFDNFSKEVDDSSVSDLVFFLAVCFALIAFTIFVWRVPVKKLGLIDSERRKVFKIIPLSMIQENKALKYYLIQNYPKEMESIKNVL